jgi:dienelactone hydrolase
MLRLLCLTLVLAVIVGKNTVVVRGHVLDMYYFPGNGGNRPVRPAVLFVPGDGGWHGLAVTIAQTMASWGYDVYALDTKRYLESFSSNTPLTDTSVMADFLQIAGWMTNGRHQSVSLVGWSEGAGLSVLAASADTNKKTFNGVVTLGLPADGVLAWHWTDSITNLTGRLPNEPKFHSADYIGRVSPLPLWMIESTHDEYVSVDTSRALFNAAQQPKRFSLIDARNHRFDGKQDELFKTLREGLAWIAAAN